MTDSQSNWPTFFSNLNVRALTTRQQNLSSAELLTKPGNHSATPYIACIADGLFLQNPQQSSLELLEISGPDALKFLQGQLSCDMTLVTSTQCQLGACINLKGRVISNFIVVLWSKNDKKNIEKNNEPAYLLICPPEMSAITATVLKKYAVFSKVSIQRADTDLIVSVTNAPLTELKRLVNGSADITPGIFAIPGSQRQLILAHSADMLKLWRSAENFQYFQGYSCWQQENINEALVFIEKSCSEMFTVQEINFELVQGVSFSKGCYTGQEVVARLHYRGVSKRRAFIAEIKTISAKNSNEEPNTLEPVAGNEIINTEKRSVGHLLTKNRIGENCYSALISLSLEEQKKYQENPGGSLLELANSNARISKISLPPYPL